MKTNPRRNNGRAQLIATIRQRIKDGGGNMINAPALLAWLLKPNPRRNRNAQIANEG